VPFGFKDAYFYDQIQYAADGLHVFTCTFINDVGDFFATLLSGGLQELPRLELPSGRAIACCFL
jgi:hypothetical protein